MIEVEKNCVCYIVVYFYQNQGTYLIKIMLPALYLFLFEFLLLFKCYNELI